MTISKDELIVVWNKLCKSKKCVKETKSYYHGKVYGTVHIVRIYEGNMQVFCMRILNIGYKKKHPWYIDYFIPRAPQIHDAYLTPQVELTHQEYQQLLNQFEYTAFKLEDLDQYL